MAIIQLEDLSDRMLRPYSGMTDGQLRRGEGFRRDNPQGLFIGESGRVIGVAADTDEGRIVESGVPAELFENPKEARTIQFLRRIRKEDEDPGREEKNV